MDKNPSGIGRCARVARAADNLHPWPLVGIESQHGKPEVCELSKRMCHQGAVIAIMPEIKQVMMENPNIRLCLGKARGNRTQRVLSDARLLRPSEAPRKCLSLNRGFSR